MLWYWRCKCEVAMVDEAEFADLAAVHSTCVCGFDRRLASGDGPSRFEDALQPFLDCYEQITGMKETNPNAIGHHRLSLYGPPCKRCGKPLRSPRAKLCGACMFPVADDC
jgi:hypothetical protein